MGGIMEVEHTSLLHVLKLLERSVRMGENLELFGDVPHREATVEVGAAKSKKTKSKKATAVAERLKSPQDHEEDKTNVSAEPKQDGKDGGTEVELEEELFVKLNRNLKFAHDSIIITADCCLVLLVSDRLPTQVMSISPCNFLTIFTNSYTHCFTQRSSSTSNSNEEPPL
jgi:cohesin loading factor subunit SCC2